MSRDIYLYSSPSYYDPFNHIAKTWLALAGYDNVKEVRSEYSWNGIGKLPNIRCDYYLFDFEHLIPFLKSALDLNSDLTEDEKREAELIEELALSKLRPAALYSMWMDDTTNKWFWRKPEISLTSFLTLPYDTIRFRLERMRVAQYLTRQHNITSHREAFYHIDSAHKLLSSKLSDNNFFFSSDSRKDVPHSTDVIIYCLLLEELVYLKNHLHVTDSLKNYPNLIQFVGRVQKLLRLSPHSTRFPELTQTFFEMDLGEVSVNGDNLPDRRECIVPENETEWEAIRYKLGKAVKPVIKAEEASKPRRIYITASAVILFLFLAIRN
jgi:hypothetical protein